MAGSKVAWMAGYHIEATRVVESVSRWAFANNFWPIPEVGGFTVDGRLDVLLVPLAMDNPMFKGTRAIVHGGWTKRLGLAAVEIKVSVSDFKHGLESGQFDRYAKDLCGLYLAGPAHIVKPADVPRQYGVLQIGPEFTRGDRIVCRRHPHWTEPKAMTDNECWRIVWKIAEQYRIEMKGERARTEALHRKIKEVTGRVITRAVQEATRGV